MDSHPDLEPHVEGLLLLAQQRLRISNGAQELVSENFDVRLSASKSTRISESIPRIQARIASNEILRHETISRNRELLPRVVAEISGPAAADHPLKITTPKSVSHGSMLEKAWHQLPHTTAENGVARDIQLLNMRDVLDPHRHYGNGSKKLVLPDCAQIGTVIEGHSEYRKRLSKKQRRDTIVKETLALPAQSARLKKKYNEVQDKLVRGKKSFYSGVKKARSR